MKDENLKQWYKKSFNDLSGSPSSDVWKNVVSSLGEKDKKRITAMLSRYIGVASVVLLLGTVGFFVFNSQTTSVSLPKVTEEHILSANNPVQAILAGNILESAFRDRTEHYLPSDAGHLPGEVIGGEPSVNSVRDQQFIEHPWKNTGINSYHIKDEDKHLVQLTIMSLKTIDEIPGREPSHFLSANLLVQKKSSSEYQAMHKDILPRGFYAGFTYSYNSLLALNQDTYDGYRSSSPTKNIALFRSSYGLIVGQNISDHSGFQAEMILNSRQGQKHKLHDGNSFIQREIILNYSRVNLLYKRKYSRLGVAGLFPISFNLIAGFYYANLEVLQRTENNELLTHKSEFLDYDFGINLGLEYDVYFLGNLAVSGGVSTSVGLVNIYKDNKIPNGYNPTHNLSFGANIGFKYIISD